MLFNINLLIYKEFVSEKGMEIEIQTNIFLKWDILSIDNAHNNERENTNENVNAHEN